jgi:hypothetical protein
MKLCRYLLSVLGQKDIDFLNQYVDFEISVIHLAFNTFHPESEILHLVITFFLLNVFR